MYYTLQGEGGQSGRPAIFLRFSGCNLWSGREEDRYKAICQFCDTDFWGTDGENGGKYVSPEEVVQKALDLYPAGFEKKYVVCTGGEPMLQLDQALVEAFQQQDFEVGIETNGTIEVDLPLDWICVSPKENTEIVQRSGNELKLVYPQGKMDPKDWEFMDFDIHYLSPMDDNHTTENIQTCIQYCKKNPFWRLSLQTHKIINIK